jgi:hypothetical protein
VWIRYVDLIEHEVQWPRVGNGRSTGHENYEGSLAADEIDQKLQEGVDCEGLRWSDTTLCSLLNGELPHIRLAMGLRKTLR